MILNGLFIIYTCFCVLITGDVFFFFLLYATCISKQVGHGCKWFMYLTIYTCFVFLFQETEFFDWINPVYISQEIQNDIRERFESESELELSDFLKVSVAVSIIVP